MLHTGTHELERKYSKETNCLDRPLVLLAFLQVAPPAYFAPCAASLPLAVSVLFTGSSSIEVRSSSSSREVPSQGTFGYDTLRWQRKSANPYARKTESSSSSSGGLVLSSVSGRGA